MSVLEKAKELGQLIIESKEFIELQSAEIQQSSNEEAMSLIADYNVKRKQLMDQMNDENITPEKMEGIKEEMQKAFEILSGNMVISNYIEKNQSFQAMMNQVNSIIGHYVNGDQSGGCGSDCGGCSGCH